MDNNYVIHQYKAMLQERLPVLKEVSSYTVKETAAMTNSTQKVVSLMNQLFSLKDMAEEYVYMLAYDMKFHPLGIFEISHGTVNLSYVQGREVFLRLCLVGAAQFILVHNHPSGISTPSSADISMAKNIKEIGKLTGIELCDFIIVGDNNHYSFREEGVL